jgi:hypothetical protein
MTKKTPDEIRLTGLKLLAKMIVAVYLKQECQVTDSDLAGEVEASCRDARPTNTANEKGD